MDERLNEMESRIALQDHTIDQLNDVVTDQQARLMRLEDLCTRLIDRLQNLQEQMPAAGAGDEKPPHY